MIYHNNIDITFIQECHLRKGKTIKTDGYNFIYNDSPVGVAVIIRNTIQYSKVSISNVGINITFIQTNSSYGNAHKKYILGSVYIPCNLQPQQPQSDLNTVLQTYVGSAEFIFGGDVTQNSKRKKFLESDWTIIRWRLFASAILYHLIQMDLLFWTIFLLAFDSSMKIIENFPSLSVPTFSDHFPIKLK